MIAADEFGGQQAAELSEWVTTLCRQYSQATGWTVRFVAETAGPLSRESLATDVVAANRRVGRIELLLGSDVDQVTRERARATTQLLVRVIEEMMVSRQDAAQRTNQLRTMVALGQTTATNGDVEETLTGLLREVAEVAEVESVSLHLLAPETDSLVLRFQHPACPGGSNPARRIAQAPTDLLALNHGIAVVDDPATLDVDTRGWIPDRTNSAVCLAVETAHETLGTLWATSRRVLGFAPQQLAVLKALAQRVGGLLDRAAGDKEDAIKERVIRELEGISKTQTGEHLGILPADSGFDAVGRCRSMCEVGGDLCELIPLGEGRTLVAVGDACGHSVQAAFVMTAVRSAMRAVIDDGVSNHLDPTDVVARINRALCLVTAGHQFMSCLVGIIDRKRMVFDYANAGHPVPILYRQGSGVALESHGLPLGIMTDATYSSGEVPLRGDDLLVLFSDGVLETMNDEQELFRSEGVMAALAETAIVDPLEDVLGRIWDSCEQHGGGTAQDDRTLLVLRMQQNQNPRRPHHAIVPRKVAISSR